MSRVPPPDLKFKVGDRVTIPYYDHGVGRVVAWRGPLGPGGAQIYDVRFGRKPYRRHIEVREDQLRPVPQPPDPPPPEPGRRVAGYTPSPGWDPNAPDILHIGTRVQFRYLPDRKGRVVEWRGPLAPGGVQVYDIRYGPKGARRYVEARRDQLVVLPPKPAAPPPDPAG